MALHISQPDKDLVDLRQDWIKVPSTVNPHYTYVDEGIVNKDNADYWRAVNMLAPVKENDIGFPADAPPDMIDVYEVQLVVYMLSVKIFEEPGLNVVFYYDHIDIPSAASGTTTTIVKTTGGEFANAQANDLVYNYDQDQWSDISNVLDTNTIQLRLAITGQGPGDHVNLHQIQETKKFKIDTGGQWESYTLSIIASMTPSQLDDMRIAVRSADGSGGAVPPTWRP